MNLDDVKQTVEERTGIPVNLLSGDTVDEVIERAGAILSMREEYETQRPKNTREQFSEWMNPDQTTDMTNVLDSIRRSTSIYPEVIDKGETNLLSDGRSANEHFTEWFREVTAFNPFKDNGIELH